MRLPFKLISNVLFTCFIGFFTVFAVTNYFLIKPYSIIVSAILTFLLTVFVAVKLYKKDVKSTLKKEEKIKAEILLTELSIKSKKEILLLFSKAFKVLGLTPTVKDGKILIKEKETAVYFCFNLEGVSFCDVIKSYKNTASKKIEIYCDNSSDKVKSFAEKFDKKITFICREKVYETLKDANSLPKNYVKLKNKPKLKENLIHALDKVKWKKYLLIGISLLFTSFLVPFKIYYIVFGSIVMIISFICLLYGKKQAE